MYEINEDTPQEELKRADHLVYVSLKYTRTCDIMKNAIHRMISAFELVMAEFLEHMRKNKKIPDVPTNVKERATLARSILGNPLNKYFILYNLLKKIDKAEYTPREEFRKNVMEIKVDNLYDYLEKTKEFVNLIIGHMK